MGRPISQKKVAGQRWEEPAWGKDGAEGGPAGGGAVLRSGREGLRRSPAVELGHPQCLTPSRAAAFCDVAVDRWNSKRKRGTLPAWHARA